MTDVTDLTEELGGLDASLTNSVALVAAFDGELARLRESLVFSQREVASLASGFSGGLKQAFDSVVLNGMELTDALRGLADTISQTVYNVALKPVNDAVGGALAEGVNAALSGLMPFAKGGAFSQGRVVPFAKGGIVSGATNFPMRGATGLMGEAGPEAIMPLSRGPDGSLGVKAAGHGGRPVNVVMNIATPDVKGFQRSQAQIAAQTIRALQRGQRNR